MRREGIPILGRSDNILGTRDDFSMVGLWEHITPTDHQMVLGVIFGDGVTRHFIQINFGTVDIGYNLEDSIPEDGNEKEEQN